MNKLVIGLFAILLVTGFVSAWSLSDVKARFSPPSQVAAVEAPNPGTTNQIGGETIGTPQPIRATSCDADGTCEIKKISMSSDVPVDYDYDFISINGLNAYGAESPHASFTTRLSSWLVLRSFDLNPEAIPNMRQSLVAPGEFQTIDSLNRGGDLQPGSLQVYKHIPGETYARIISLVADPNVDGSGIKASYLEGQGNAYACADRDGKIFRSYQPCTQVNLESNIPSITLMQHQAQVLAYGGKVYAIEIVASNYPNSQSFSLKVNTQTIGSVSQGQTVSVGGLRFQVREVLAVQNSEGNYPVISTLWITGTS